MFTTEELVEWGVSEEVAQTIKEKASERLIKNHFNFFHS